MVRYARRAPYDKGKVSRTILMGCRLHIACHPSEPQSVLRPRHVQHGGRRCRVAVASLSSLTLPAPGKASDGQHGRQTPPGRQDTARASHRTLAAAEGVRPARLAAQLQAIAKTAAADTAAHPREPGIAELVTAIDAAIPHMDQALPLPIAPPGPAPTAPGVASRQTPTDPDLYAPVGVSPAPAPAPPLGRVAQAPTASSPIAMGTPSHLSLMCYARRRVTVR
jgi:hypothetical protein